MFGIILIILTIILFVLIKQDTKYFAINNELLYFFTITNTIFFIYLGGFYSVILSCLLFFLLIMLSIQDYNNLKKEIHNNLSEEFIDTLPIADMVLLVAYIGNLFLLISYNLSIVVLINVILLILYYIIIKKYKPFRKYIKFLGIEDEEEAPEKLIDYYKTNNKENFVNNYIKAIKNVKDNNINQKTAPLYTTIGSILLLNYLFILLII